MRLPVVFGALLSAIFVSSAALARGHSCTEVSDVVGYEHCTRYGNEWAEERAAPVSLELSLGPTWFDPHGRTMSGSFGKNQPGSFKYPGNDVKHSLWALPLSLRIAFPFVPWAYAGFEFQFGLGANKLPATEANNYFVSASNGGPASSVEFGGGLYGGLRAPLGYLSVRAEAFFGGRSINTSQLARSYQYGNRSASVSLDTWVIEPRVYLDVWVTPWMTLSGFGGMNALHFTDHNGGLVVGFHGSHYDGAFLW